MLNIEDTELNTWFERDRQHVELRDKATQETIVEWWDDAVTEAADDGFLDFRGYIMGREMVSGPLHESAYDYAVSMNIL